MSPSRSTIKATPSSATWHSTSWAPSTIGGTTRRAMGCCSPVVGWRQDLGDEPHPNHRTSHRARHSVGGQTLHHLRYQPGPLRGQSLCGLDAVDHYGFPRSYSTRRRPRYLAQRRANPFQGSVIRFARNLGDPSIRSGLDQVFPAVGSEREE